MNLPHWLYDEVEGHWIGDFYGEPVIASCGYVFEPYYWDPTLIEQHGELLRAMADQHAARPEWQDGLAWVDISAYGFWGEWHSEIEWPDWITRTTTLQTFVDQYVEAFPQDETDRVDLSMNVIGPYFDDDQINYAIEDQGANMVRRGIGYL
jgi:hypothetical protein